MLFSLTSGGSITREQKLCLYFVSSRIRTSATRNLISSEERDGSVLLSVPSNLLHVLYRVYTFSIILIITVHPTPRFFPGLKQTLILFRSLKQQLIIEHNWVVIADYQMRNFHEKQLLGF